MATSTSSHAQQLSTAGIPGLSAQTPEETGSPPAEIPLLTGDYSVIGGMMTPSAPEPAILIEIIPSSKRIKGARIKKFVCEVATPSMPPKGASFADNFPEVAKEWDESLNRWGPECFHAGSGYHAWWRCHEDPRHRWSAPILSRGRGGNGCPYHAGFRVLPEDSLKALFPETAARYEADGRNPRPADEVAPHAGFDAYFRCKAGKHSYVRRVADEVVGGGYCAQCDDEEHVALYHTAETLSRLTREWSPANGKPPPEFRHDLKTMSWWRCEHDHPDWDAPVDARMRGKGECPRCVDARRSIARHDSAVMNGNVLSTKDPTVASQLRGGRDPAQVCAGSKRLEWWECGCGKGYATPPAARTIGAVDCCPACGKRRHKSRGEVAVYAELLCFFPSLKNGAVIDDTSWDIMDPELRLIIEFDGRYFHGAAVVGNAANRDPDVVRRDKANSVKAIDSGYTLLRLREEPLPSLGIAGVDELFFSLGAQDEFQGRIVALVARIFDFIITRFQHQLPNIEDLRSALVEYRTGDKMRAWADFRERASRLGLPSEQESLKMRFPKAAKLIHPAWDPAKLSHGMHQLIQVTCPHCRNPEWVTTAGKLVEAVYPTTSRTRGCMECSGQRRWESRRRNKAGTSAPQNQLSLFGKEVPPAA